MSDRFLLFHLSIDQMIGFDLPITEIQLFFNELPGEYLKVRIILNYNCEFIQNIQFSSHPMLKKQKVICEDDLQEFVFLFHTRA